MKKIYIEPTLTEVIIKAPTILAGSGPDGNSMIDPAQELDPGEGGIASHGDDFDWDEEE